MSSAVRHAARAPGVADIVVEDGGTDHVVRALSIVRAVAWVGGVLVAALALVIAFATFRVRLDEERAELAVAQLFGASPAFAIVPTALAGAMLGIAAAIVATIALAFGIMQYGDAIASSLADVFGAVEVMAPTAGEIAAFVATAGMLGFIGGALAGGSRALR
jgi:cell division protein FtsX